MYILFSPKLDKYYVGSSNNPDRRLLNEHNLDKSKFTKLGIPWKLMFKQYYPSVTIARKVEYRIKQLKSRKIIERIIADKVCKIQLRGT